MVDHSDYLDGDTKRTDEYRDGSITLSSLIAVWTGVMIGDGIFALPGQVVELADSLLMYFSMVINESLVARTFDAYTMRILGEGSDSWLVPALSVGLIAVAFVVNLFGNRVITHSRSPQHVKKNLLWLADIHRHDQAQFDDITLIILRV